MCDAIDLVHDTLEYLKYVGGKHNNRPTGEGIDINIVILPDFLVDIRADKIEKPDVSNINKNCVVGGRAGRAACTLFHLLENCEETFSCHLLTKTAPLGCSVLDDELSHSDENRLFAAKYRSFILSGKAREPRFAIRRGTNVSAGPAIASEELSAKDIYQNKPLKTVIQRSISVYLSSAKHPNFSELFEYLLLRNDTGAFRVFLDISRMEDEEAITTFRNCLLKWKALSDSPEGLDKLAGIFMPGNTPSKLFQIFSVDNIDTFATKFNCPVIHYTDNSIRYLFHGECSSVDQILINMNEEDVSEKFKAGILLAWSIYKSLYTIDQSHPMLFQHLFHRWGANKISVLWKNILLYGFSLAAQKNPTHSHYCTLKQLLNTKDTGVYDPVFELSQTPLDMMEYSALRIQAEKLVYARRNKKWNIQQFIKCQTGKLRCRTCRHLPQNDLKAVVMIDLDGTLMNSTLQRKRCLRAAMKELYIHRDSCHIFDKLNTTPDASDVLEYMIDFFNSNIYDLWPLYKELNLGDFRQEWNHFGWYACFLVLSEKPLLSKYIKDIKKENDDHDKGNVRDNVAFSTWQKNFTEHYQRVRKKYSFAIQKAQTAFEEVKLYPFREAYDLLTSLRDSGQFRLYIVSEGNSETQWKKICNSGLDEYFDRDHVLTTGDAGNPDIEQKHLDNANRRLSSDMAGIKQQIGQAQIALTKIQDLKTQISAYCITQLVYQTIFCNSNGLESIIQSHIQKLENYITSLRLREKYVEAFQYVIDLVGKVIHRMAIKSGIPFYSAVIRAILRNPDHAREQLGNFSSLCKAMDDSNRETKFAMIGDRLIKDINPPTKLLGNDFLLGIHILSDKYAFEVGDMHYPQKYKVDTLAQAKMILLAKEAWQSIKCCKDPSIFHCNISEFNEYCKHENPDDLTDFPLPLLLKGIYTYDLKEEDDFEILREICSGILKENLLKMDEDRRDDAYENCMNTLNTDSPTYIDDVSQNKERLSRAKYFHGALIKYDIVQLFSKNIQEKIHSK